MEDLKQALELVYRYVSIRGSAWSAEKNDGSSRQSGASPSSTSSCRRCSPHKHIRTIHVWCVTAPAGSGIRRPTSMNARLTASSQQEQQELGDVCHKRILPSQNQEGRDY